MKDTEMSEALRLHAEALRLHAEVLRLSQALVAAFTASETLSAERDFYRAEAAHLKKIGDSMRVEGYDQAVKEIRDHFRKAGHTKIAAEIEKIWMKGKLP